MSNSKSGPQYLHLSSVIPKSEDIGDQFTTDDSTFNFRVNADLKKEFSKLCRRDQLTAASALKRYMLSCVRKGEITNVI